VISAPAHGAGAATARCLHRVCAGGDGRVIAARDNVGAHGKRQRVAKIDEAEYGLQQVIAIRAPAGRASVELPAPVRGAGFAGVARQPSIAS
jgi:hypothetical protein